MKYDYKCDSCGKGYSETREETDPQWITKCDVCPGNFVEVTE